MNKAILKQYVKEASNVIGKTWPLYSFVTSNPLTGYESMPFEKAVNSAKHLLGANVYPETELYKAALNDGSIENNILIDLLTKEGFLETPETYLNQLLKSKTEFVENETQDLDRTLAKYLSVFLDEGLAEWDMPNRELGFYKAWRKLAKYDKTISLKGNLPNTATEALTIVLKHYSEENYIQIFKTNLAALPGYVGYINHRNENNTEWQQNFPIDLLDYLAVRLWYAQALNIDLLPNNQNHIEQTTTMKLQELFLKAWEMTWQNSISNTLQDQAHANSKINKKALDAQLVFCIDTRSELIRRHVESKGHYETFGYAGFFGIATDYVNPENGIARKSCPPILNSAYQTSEITPEKNDEQMAKFKKRVSQSDFKNYVLKRMKNMLPSAFGFVEGTGILYGFSLVARTLLPGQLYRKQIKKKNPIETFCITQLDYISDSKTSQSDIALDEKVTIVKSAFDLLGWTEFAPLVIFSGHGSHTANNAFASSLDCGACAASPGRHNARMLAKLANDIQVRSKLNLEYGIKIPDSTVFVGAEHNTTTDAIELFDAEVPKSHLSRLKALKQDLVLAQETATQERLSKSTNSVALAHINANNWSETRPEWGLAKNSGFIIGSRKLTKNLQLDGKCFLHSYEWDKDPEGNALEGIMQGPMVVTQWINNHYYFSTVDNDFFGGGTKITHNVTGKFGVVQGNGGDLKMGLPLQSIKSTDEDYYHKPLRLSVMIHAPIARVSEILLNNPHLRELLDNSWIYLLVMDPFQQNSVNRYTGNMNWTPVTENPDATTTKRETKTVIEKEELLEELV